MDNPVPKIDLDFLRKLVSTVAVCTDDPTHEVRCNDEELRQMAEPILELSAMYHRVVQEGLITQLKLTEARRRQAELERRWMA